MSMIKCVAKREGLFFGGVKSTLQWMGKWMDAEWEKKESCPRGTEWSEKEFRAKLRQNCLNSHLQKICTTASAGKLWGQNVPGAQKFAEPHTAVRSGRNCSRSS